MTEKFWLGTVPAADDFGARITTEFIDGKTKMGPWANMAPETYRRYGTGLGTGRGQRYVKQDNGRWLKVEG